MQSQTAASILLKQQSDPRLTRKEAAEYLGVTERTLAVWASLRRYDIPYIKVGRLVRYRQSDLDAFLARRTIGGEG